MFRLIKWTFIVAVIGSIWYGISFFRGLSPEEASFVKEQTLKAIDSKDTGELTNSLSQKIQEDVAQKKANFFERVRQKAKTLINDLL